MATEGGSSSIDVSVVASEDLSSKQYYAVGLDTTAPFKVKILTGTAGANRIFGILQNKPESGESAVVRVSGVSKHIIGDGTSMTPGDVITAGNDGKGEQADADAEYGYGMLISDADDGDIATILVSNMGWLGKTDV